MAKTGTGGATVAKPKAETAVVPRKKAKPATPVAKGGTAKKTSLKPAVAPRMAVATNKTAAGKPATGNKNSRKATAPNRVSAAEPVAPSAKAAVRGTSGRAPPENKIAVRKSGAQKPVRMAAKTSATKRGDTGKPAATAQPARQAAASAKSASPPKAVIPSKAAAPGKSAKAPAPKQPGVAQNTILRRPAARTAVPTVAARRARTAGALRKAAASRGASTAPPLNAPALKVGAVQSFAVSHLDEADFKADGLRAYARYRDLGIAAASGGLCQAHVIRFTPPCTDEVRKRHTHQVDLQLIYVLQGWIKNEFEGHGEQMMSTGSCWLQPSGIRHTVLDYSADCEVLEIIVPADFKTDEAD